MLLSRGCIGQSLGLYIFISEGTSTFTLPTHSIAVSSFTFSTILSVTLECTLCTFSSFNLWHSFYIILLFTGMHIMVISSRTFILVSTVYCHTDLCISALSLKIYYGQVITARWCLFIARSCIHTELQISHINVNITTFKDLIHYLSVLTVYWNTLTICWTNYLPYFWVIGFGFDLALTLQVLHL